LRDRFEFTPLDVKDTKIISDLEGNYQEEAMARVSSNYAVVV
jgi:hypothetical protein